MSSQNWRRVTGSTPPVGSSRNTMLGSWKMANEKASFCFQPRGNDFTIVFLSDAKPSSSSSSVIFSFTRLRGMP